MPMAGWVPGKIPGQWGIGRKVFKLQFSHILGFLGKEDPCTKSTSLIHLEVLAAIFVASSERTGLADEMQGISH